MTFGFLGLALVFNNCSQFSIDSDKNNSVGALELSGAQAGTAAENLWLRSQSSIASAMATVPRTNMAGCEITGDYRSERNAMGTRKNLLRRGRANRSRKKLFLRSRQLQNARSICEFGDSTLEFPRFILDDVAAPVFATGPAGKSYVIALVT